MSEEIFITKNSEETQKVGENFILQKKATVVALYGDLGSGKTTFAQGMAKGLGITKRLISPTFIIVRQYKIKNQRSNIKNKKEKLKFFYHIDLYRVQSEQYLEGLGIKEILSDPQNIVAIEWAERMGNLLPEKRWEVKFEDLGEEKRKITIKLKSQSAKIKA